jgi:protein-S-isoprenylcysteine O-methyltransferase Ste14
MKCKKCGTEIADKALICYRCGTSTFEPPTPTGERRRTSRLLPSLIALVLLIGAGLFMAGTAVSETPRVLGWILVGLAIVLIVWQVGRLRRRRR